MPIPEGVEREEEEPTNEKYGEGIANSGDTAPLRNIFKAPVLGNGRSVDDLRGNGSC